MKLTLPLLLLLATTNVAAAYLDNERSSSHLRENGDGTISEEEDQEEHHHLLLLKRGLQHADPLSTQQKAKEDDIVHYGEGAKNERHLRKKVRKTKQVRQQQRKTKNKSNKKLTTTTITVPAANVPAIIQQQQRQQRQPKNKVGVVKVVNSVAQSGPTYVKRAPITSTFITPVSSLIGGGKQQRSNSITNSDDKIMLDMINKERADRKLPSLVFSQDLQKEAQRWARYMGVRNYFEHRSPFSLNLNNDWQYVGENIAWDYSVNKAHVGLMNSVTHRENILEPSYDKIGIGIYAENKGDHNVYWVCQIFKDTYVYY